MSSIFNMSATSDDITVIEMENIAAPEKQDGDQPKLRLHPNGSKLDLFDRLSQCGDLHGIIQISELRDYVHDPSKSNEVIIVGSPDQKYYTIVVGRR